MQFLQSFYLNTLKYDLINKFTYKNTYAIPKVKKIILNFGSQASDFKQLASSLFVIEWITNQKGILTKTKKSNISLKMRKGSPVGCKVTLRNYNLHNFFARIIIEILPLIKPLKKSKITQKLEKNTFSYDLHNIFTFTELKRYYYFLPNLSKLKISIVTNAKNRKELLFLLKSFQLSL
jgi:large subunit ribosomal protein L5